MLHWTSRSLRPRSRERGLRPRCARRSPRSSSMRSGSTIQHALDLGLAEDHPATQGQLPAGERLRVARRGLHPAKPQQPAEELLVEPVLRRLARVVLARSESSFSSTSSSVSGTKTFGRAEVAVVLRDLVLEDQVVAERVPRRARDASRWSWCRSERGMREDEVGLDRLQALEDLLDGPADVRQEAVRKSWTGARPPTGAAARNAAALARASSARSPCGREDDPGDLELGCARVSARSVPPQPISMSSAWQPIARTRRSRAAVRREREPEHLVRTTSRSRGASHGMSPLFDDRVEVLLVLDRVHRRPEAVVGDTRSCSPSAGETRGLVHDVLAGLQLVEDLRPEDEEASVDPHVRRIPSGRSSGRSRRRPRRRRGS